MALDERYGEYPPTEAPRLCPSLIEYAAQAEAAINDPEFDWDDNEISTDDFDDDDEEDNTEVCK